jgi:uncharacterized protein
MDPIKETVDLFYIGESPEASLAWIEFGILGNVLTIFHTEVTDALKGQGVGQQLVQHVVAYARNNHLKVYPDCTYASGQFKKHPEYQDVLVTQS